MASRKQKHLMLSYQWDDQTLVKHIHDELTKAGINVWMDIAGGMHANINTAMADGVENAAVICPMLTEKYQASKNCRKELNYADTLNIPIVPLVTNGYRPSGWVGAITAGLTPIEFSSEANTESNLKLLIAQVKSLWANQIGLGHARGIEDWIVTDVLNMLQGLNLDEYSEAVKANAVNGELLVKMTEQTLETELGIRNTFHRRKILQEIKYLNERGPRDYTATVKPKTASAPVSGSDAASNKKVVSAFSDISTMVHFQNDSSVVADVFWIDFKGEEVWYNTLEPGQQYSQQTYVEHPWVCRAQETGECLLINGTRLFFPDVEETVGIISGETRSSVKSQEVDHSNGMLVVSYHPSSMEVAEAIANQLSELGIPVWIDVGNSSLTLEEALEKAKVIVPIMSPDYQADRNCQRTLNYADTLNVPIVPVRCVEGFEWKASGWLGAITAGLLWVQFDPTGSDVSEKIPQLSAEVLHVWGDALGKGRKLDILFWDEELVCRFLEGLELSEHCASFTKNGINGGVLLTLSEPDLRLLGVERAMHIQLLESEISKLRALSALEQERATSEVASASASAPTEGSAVVTAVAVSQTRVVKSQNSGISTSVYFQNSSSKTCSVYWIDYNGEEVYYASLSPGEEYEQQTYVEHPWVVKDTTQDTYLLINGARLFFPDADPIVGVITGEDVDSLKLVTSSSAAQHVFELFMALKPQERSALLQRLIQSSQL